MERTFRLLPRYQVLFDLACHMPAVDTASVKTYFFFLKVAHDVFAAQQAFYDRFELSEGKMVVLLLLHQAPHYRLTPSALDLFEQMLPQRFEHIGEFMSSLTEEEQHQLRALLEKMNRGLPALGTS